MTDPTNIHERIASRLRIVATEPEADAFDDCGAYGCLRGTRDRANMIDFRHLSGLRDAFPYSTLDRISFDPSDGLILRFLATRVILKGRNFATVPVTGVSFLEAIQRHRVPWVQEMDELRGTMRPADAVVITRRWSVQRIGIYAVETLARRALDPDCKPAVRTSLAWVHHDIHHDDPAAIQHWLAEADTDSQQTSPARWILERLESMQSDIVPLLLEALGTNSPELQRTVLVGLARLAYCSTVLKDSTAPLCGALAMVPREVRYRLCVLRNGPVTLLEIARTATAVLGNANRLARARSLLAPQLLWVDDSCLSVEAVAHARIRAIGKQLYVPINSYWAETNTAAAEVTEPDEVLSVLLSWLESEHRSPGPAKIIPELLTATEAVARLSPDAFRKTAHPDVWEPFLSQCIQSEEHWTSRLAAVRLLGRLRRVTDHVVRALRSAMNDVCFVQTAAYESACEFRRVEGDILPELLLLLSDPSAGVSAATTRLLIGIARAECTASDRRRILRSLQDAWAQTSAPRPVYLMIKSGEYMQISFENHLDRILYHAISEISGSRRGD